jgi:ABC-type Na+ efflux pump permease subunit
MSPRIKKLIGSGAMVAGLVAYVLGAIALADFVPKHRLAQFLYFAVAGIAWSLPAIPLIKWMNAEPKRRP